MHFPAFPAPLPHRDQLEIPHQKTDTKPQKSANLRAVSRTLVFAETLVSQLCIERPDEVDRYGEGLDYLRDAALNPRESAKEIEEIRGEM